MRAECGCRNIGGIKMEDWEGMESNCCGAEIVCMDVCSDCKEHCCPQEDENDD